MGNAIVNMAQDFVGTNNLPGTSRSIWYQAQRWVNHASHRYIFTVKPWVNYAFPEADLPVLKYSEVDGHVVER